MTWRVLTGAYAIHARLTQSLVPTERQNTHPSRQGWDSLVATGR